MNCPTHAQTDSNSEAEFQRRKARSMAHMRAKVLPLGPPGSTQPQVAGTVTVTADIAPMAVDTSVSFESIGGLEDRACLFAAVAVCCSLLVALR